MNCKLDDNHIIQYYSQLTNQHGISPHAVDWGSRESQRLRFDILTQIGNLNNRTLLDLGCGQADLFAYLQSNNIKSKYTGYDLTPKMIKVAKEKFPEAQLEIKDILDESEILVQFDYILASGIFYLRKTEPLSYLKLIASRMFSLCRNGIAFNSLSSYASSKEGGEFYAKPTDVLEICLRITPYVILRHDYFPHDFTVYLYKKEL